MTLSFNRNRPVHCLQSLTISNLIDYPFKISTATRIRIMMYKGHITAPNRAFDHLYDPLYLTADIKDIHKQNRSALTRTAPVNIYPIYENMFTDLNQCPRNIYTFQQNPLPVNVTSKGKLKIKSIPATGVEKRVKVE